MKIFVASIFLILAAGLCTYFLFSENQIIETRFIPTQFENCGRKISVADSDYIKLTEWLENNKNGWSRDWSTPIAGNVYHSPSFSVVAFETGVSVSYKTDTDFPRFVKTTDHQLKISCQNGS